MKSLLTLIPASAALLLASVNPAQKEKLEQSTWDVVQSSGWVVEGEPVPQLVEEPEPDYQPQTSTPSTTEVGSSGVKSGGSCGKLAAPVTTVTYSYAAPVVYQTSGNSCGTLQRNVCAPQTSYYTPRWNNHDGMPKNQHAMYMHGIDTTGMSNTQVAMMLDADHDANGAYHSQIQRTRTGLMGNSRSVVRQTAQSCPNGVCEVPKTNSWYLGKNLPRNRK